MGTNYGREKETPAHVQKSVPAVPTFQSGDVGGLFPDAHTLMRQVTAKLDAYIRDHPVPVPYRGAKPTK